MPDALPVELPPVEEGDQVKAGEVTYAKPDENTVIVREIVVLEKTFGRDELNARREELLKHKEGYQAKLADIVARVDAELAQIDVLLVKLDEK